MALGRRQPSSRHVKCPVYGVLPYLPYYYPLIISRYVNSSVRYGCIGVINVGGGAGGARTYRDGVDEHAAGGF